jgi:indolepyruvate ferredoxin oxidoreductase
MTANVFLLGAAWQQGLVPVSLAGMTRAIELNGVAVAANTRAFHWGRVAAHDRTALDAAIGDDTDTTARARTLDELVIAHAWDLADYQNDALAGRYKALVRRVAEAERATVGGDRLAAAVARSYYKLLAYKDEYEVARLYSDGRFAAKLANQFDGDVRLTFHLAPPLLARPDPRTGRPKKIKLGGWMRPVFKALSWGKALRGTPFDPFGRQHERREERRLIAEYEQTVETLIAGLTAANHPLAVRIAELPLRVRGYGPVKAQAIAAYEAERATLLAQFAAGEAAVAVAAE